MLCIYKLNFSLLNYIFNLVPPNLIHESIHIHIRVTLSHPDEGKTKPDINEIPKLPNK